MPHPNPSVAMASTAHKMVSVLNYTCPPNYVCGGPAYAAVSSIDSILHLMGIGIPLIQRNESLDTTEFQKEIRQQAMVRESILGGYQQHKSQIVSAALLSVLFDARRNALRETPSIAWKAVASLMEWLCKKTGEKPEKLLEMLKEGGHDELIQMENDLNPEEAPKEEGDIDVKRQ